MPLTVPLPLHPLAAEFEPEPGLSYLNHAGVAPWPRRTAEAINRFAEENVRRGARDYPQWLDTEQRLRERLARLINAPSPADIALAKNTSEALSMVAYGLDWNPGDNLVISDEEFPSNRIVWESLARFGVEVRQVPLAGDPEAALIARMDGRTRLLSVSSVQYASGLRLDLARLAEACRGSGVLLCVDAIQQLGAVQFDLARSDADFVVADGHKWMLGPEGLALFYCRPALRERLRLHEYGWHSVEQRGDYDRRDWSLARDARRFECGSPNMLGVYGLEASLSLIEELGMEAVEQAVLARTRWLAAALGAIPGIRLLTDLTAERYAGILTFRHDRITPEALFAALTRTGVVCARRGGGVRFSPHFHTPQERLAQAVAAVAQAVGEG